MLSRSRPALSGGLVLADIPEEKREILFSQNYACDDCGISIEELTPRMFSFNSPYGACPTCGGLGTRLRIDPALIIPDLSKSILDGGITASGWNGVKDESLSRMYYDALAEKYHFDLATPIGDLPERVRGDPALRNGGRGAHPALRHKSRQRRAAPPV